MKVVCLTGVTGFLGSHLARAFVHQGWEVHGFKRSTSDLTRLRDVRDRMVFHDVDREPLEALFPSSRPPDAVLHLATNYGRNGELASQVAQVNTLFPLTLLEESIRREVPLFLHADTCFQVQYRFLQAYTLSKQHFAAWGEILAGGKTRFVNVKLYHPYGPGDGPGKFVPQMIRSCLESNGDIDLTLGEQKKDFIFVDDVVSAFQVLLANGDHLPAGFVSVDCGSGQATSIRTFVETVHRLTGSRARLRFGALPYRDNEVMFSQADISRLRALGWKPAIPLEDGIRRILREEPSQEKTSTPREPACSR